MSDFDYTSISPIYLERFLSKVLKSDDPNTCWLWGGGIAKTGYGQQFVGKPNGKNSQAPAHRLAYFVAYGAIPDKLFVCHHCDNPACVNPAHLFLGTVLDNNRDKVRKNRHPFGDSHHARAKPEVVARGERVGTSKLKEEQVRDILNLHAKGVNQNELAAKFSVSTMAVFRIVHRLTWKHVK